MFENLKSFCIETNPKNGQNQKENDEKYYKETSKVK